MKTNDDHWRKKIFRLSTHYSWLRQHGISLTFLPPGFWQFLHVPHLCLSYGSTREVNRMINREWCFEGLLNTQAQCKRHRRLPLPPIRLSAVPETGCATVETAGLSTATGWTFWQSQARQHAGRAGGTGKDAQARGGPGADSGLGPGSPWADEGWEALWTVCPSERSSTLTPLNITATEPEPKTCRTPGRPPEVPEVILIAFFPLGLPSLFLFKIPTWIWLCLACKLLQLLCRKRGWVELCPLFLSASERGQYRHIYTHIQS